MTADPIYTLLQSTAKAIAGSDNPPAWLVEGIPNIVNILNGNIAVENAMPDRDQWRKRFQCAANSARHLLKELQDYNTNHGFLVMLMNTSSINERPPYEQASMIEGLESLVARCEEKISELPVTHGGKKTAAKIDETPTGKTLCALAVALAWKYIHREWPGVNNSAAHAACRNLWKAAGGRRRKSDTVSLSWRSYLEKVRKPSIRNSWQASVLLRQWGCK